MTVMVRIEHMRACRMCARGGRAFFARHGLDWPAFLAGGLPVEQIEATGDAMALKLAAYARAEAAGEGDDGR